MYDGELPESISSVARKKLESLISPSSISHYPILTNFCLEAKSCNGQAYVGRLQACHDSALGARAMHAMQRYASPLRTGIEHTARSFACAFHDGSLRMFATHLEHSANPSITFDYRKTQLGSFSLTHNHERRIEGIGAFRNLRELAHSMRKEVVAQVNLMVASAGRLTQTPASSQPVPSLSVATTVFHSRVSHFKHCEEHDQCLPGRVSYEAQ